MLIHRVLSAAVVIPLAVIAVCKGGLWLTILLCLCAVIGLHEFNAKAKARQIHVITPIGYLTCLGLILLSFARTLPTESPYHLLPERYDRAVMGALFLLVMGSLVVSVFRYHRNQQEPVVANVGATVLGSLYVGVTFSFFLFLRVFQGGETPVAIAGFPNWPQEFGARLLLLLLCATWATDTGAYFVGKNLGKHKLTPASPNKTIEGTIGGFVAAIVVAMFVGSWLRLPVSISCPVGAITGIMGQLGDLCKSIMKRDLGTKDFGALIPGHGGILDRLDSLMLNVPIIYLYIILVR